MKILLIGSEGKMGHQMQNVIRKNNLSFLGIDIDNREDAEKFNADVILDFSSSSCLHQNLILAKNKNIPIVIATTNHDSSNLDLIEKFKKELPIFMSSNFSIMFHALLKMIRQLKILDECDFLVEDTHHKHKKDSPSGSCKEIIKVLNEIGVTADVSSHRVGEVIGIHDIKIYADNECLEIKHQATSREVFCQGALKACEFILNKPNGLYTMNDML